MWVALYNKVPFVNISKLPYHPILLGVWDGKEHFACVKGMKKNEQLPGDLNGRSGLTGLENRQIKIISFFHVSCICNEKKNTKVFKRQKEI